jgi:23S rRNA (uracil1939-C5)-methyltransferase
VSRRARRRPPPEGEFVGDIADLTQEGQGVSRGTAEAPGKVTFIDRTLPGERVRYRLTHVSRNADNGRLVAVERASPHRVEPGCPHFGLCGGCALQHLAPEQQVLFKQKQLLDALQRIGNVEPEELAAPVTGPWWGYRRRARLGAKLVPKKGGVLVGFREREAPLLAAIDSCAVLDPRVGLLIKELAALIGSLSVAAQLPQLEVSCADHVAIVLRVLADPTVQDREALAAFAACHDLDFYLQRGGIDSIVPLAQARPLRYSPDGSALELEFGPADFIQVNGAVSQSMVRQALDWLAPVADLAVLELFAGLGNFTAPLARAGAQVTAVEGDAALVARGRENLARNGLKAKFLQADLFAADAQSPWPRQQYDAALLDPPRSGAREILPALVRTMPRRIVYVSCHPGTLARDAAALVTDHGYRLRRAGVLDMFPHTAHVESMALFEAKGRRSESNA